MTPKSERAEAVQAIAKLLDAAGVECPIEEITSKLNLRELRGLKYRVERARAEAYEEGIRLGSDPRSVDSLKDH